MTLKKMSSYRREERLGVLYLVPTPIGNLGDMTYRAVDVLKKADLIAAEDTRNTQKLLNHFEIKTPQISFHEHNTQARIPQLIKKLTEGINIAQVSDAGTPSISDPGHELVVACVEAGISVIPLPGANAGLSALIASGLNPQPFTFIGFISRRKKEKEEQLKFLAKKQETLIFYEAPHRLKKTLESLQAFFGGARKIVLCRELTKRYEEFIRGTVAEALEWAKEEQVRGEFCIILEGNPDISSEEDNTETVSVLPLEEQVDNLINKENYRPNDAIKEVAKKNNLKKQVVYNTFHHIDV
ncbi:16S rRNA (cytidine(1402)-2'-O)-methyltransferase [Liquorilactobacillus mali]|uniref:Ribosomal RNA small subunit methyltransferase I n=1 Tax=Liquorilactobacillus mali TaxID=1618 RepID=A0A0R2FSV8_9LACO|nr:16S rRNA (cytidine(1402)-2'-O)-methyltransferase [Liquorilactobacillus mali]KRN28250.1 Tetrapyrrole (Corrin Porphyrin) methylase family protein [Liquorilactobacillus mali]MDN7146469.1 16S rRNA (cytidine(1402)-2'-O)-methyltransferase [Liquorilactobacillus mali]